MGFSTNILILNPEKLCQSTMWVPHTLLIIGRVGTMVIRDKELQKRDPRLRATLCFMECVFDRLTQLSTDKGREIRAPYFVEPKKVKISHDCIQHMSIGHITVPARSDMEEHNEKYRMPAPDEEKRDIVFARPMIWVMCSLVAGWLTQGETGDLHFRLQSEDTEAKLILDRWKNALLENCESKALFYFNELHLDGVTDNRII